MVAKLTEADLATSLTLVLDRVRGGERIVVERDGEEIAVLTPPAPKSGITLRELAANLATLPPLDEKFATAVEAVQSSQTRSEPPAWDN